MDLGAPELILILLIVVLLFGVGRIGKVAGEMGSGIRAFREGLRGEEDGVKEDGVKYDGIKEMKLPEAEKSETEEPVGSVQTKL